MKNKVVRYTLNGVILAAVAAIGIAAYQIGTSPTEEKIIQEMDENGSEKYAMLEEELAENENLNEQENFIEEDDFENEVSSEEIFEEINLDDDEDYEVSDKEEAEEPYEGEYSEGYVEESELSNDNISNEMEEVSVEAELIDIEVPEEDMESVGTSAKANLMQLHFSEEVEMEWPLQGDIILDYNMDQTIYFPTLDQYKLNPAIAVRAEEGTPVLAAATGMVYDIVQSAQTGTTVTMELGNGYQAIYGQLKDLSVEAGEIIEKGTVIGYIDVPTKYYAVEGSNLYYTMKKNGEYINPTEYLPQ